MSKEVSESGENLRSDDKIVDVCSGTPLNRADLTRELPSLNFATDEDFPQTDNALLVATGHPRAIRADAQTAGVAACVSEAQRAIGWEGPQTAWAGELGDKAFWIDVQLLALDTRCKVEVELPREAHLNELIVGRHEAERGVLLREVVALAVFFVGGLPGFPLCVSREVLFGWIVGLGVGRKTRLRCRSGWRVV